MKNLVKVLNKEIKIYFSSVKTKNVRRVEVPRNAGSLWKAVKAAHDSEVYQLPNRCFLMIPWLLMAPCRMCLQGQALAEKTLIDDTVYNSKKLLNSENKMFMNSIDVRECIL
jgi:hypothetical protein